MHINYVLGGRFEAQQRPATPEEHPERICDTLYNDVVDTCKIADDVEWTGAKLKSDRYFSQGEALGASYAWNINRHDRSHSVSGYILFFFVKNFFFKDFFLFLLLCIKKNFAILSLNK